MDTNTPPEDSIFSLPSYRASQFGSSSGQVQMDPAMAMHQSQVKSTLQNIAKGVTVAVLMLAIIGGGTAYFLTNTVTETRASIDLRQAVMGIVSSVDEQNNSFVFTDAKSDDPKISSTGITTWTVQLPPGASFTRESTLKSTCNTISSFERNFSDSTPVSCVNFLKAGDQAVIQYLVVQSQNSTIVTSKIIVERK